MADQNVVFSEIVIIDYNIEEGMTLFKLFGRRTMRKGFLTVLAFQLRCEKLVDDELGAFCFGEVDGGAFIQKPCHDFA